jgi:carboxymethylenebutenolidase
MGEVVEFKSNGDTAGGYLARSATPGPGVIVLQEWWGVVPHITNVADRFAASGITALVPDLYHGEASSEPNEAAKLMMGMNMNQVAKDMSGAVDFVADVSDSPGSVGVVGFCMGGGLALVLACQRPDAVAAVVPFYGLIPWPSAQPDYSKLAAALQGHYAEKDGFASPTLVQNLESDLKKLGKEVEFFVYPRTEHAFFNDDRPEVYDADAAVIAWGRTIDFLSSKLTTSND